MKYIDLTFPTPEENLAFDEALLNLAEKAGAGTILRFWEPAPYFVVLGYSGKVQEEVHVSACRTNHIPILRRSSGGGTVLQGPGCLNFSLILKIGTSKSLGNITQTNAYVLEKNKQALFPLLNNRVEMQGLSDLTYGALKFSGNAQRRKRHFLLFHGTFLLNFDIPLIERYLLLPKRQPLYRKNRNHQDFLTNLNFPSESVKDALRKAWQADQKLKEIPREEIRELVVNRYSTQEWNFKF
ncbi:MAG: lipoate--protein ligase family protein [Candidatus Omnitrophica bacterium]|nr:lipoate--protein ligase family protein [Candidatus Omnitrophota bacterium]